MHTLFAASLGAILVGTLLAALGVAMLAAQSMLRVPIALGVGALIAGVLLVATTAVLARASKASRGDDGPRRQVPRYRLERDGSVTLLGATAPSRR